VFAGYTVVRPIGIGGMGAVYLVQHPRLPRHDALKLLNRELSTESDFVARFLREADIVSRLSHRNIVSIYDRGEENGQLWLTMRYVDGIDVEAALAQAGGILPAHRAVHIVSEVASALDAAHRLHLVHRDVKPANILLSASDDDDEEQVFLTDFGIAKSLDAGGRLTRTGLVVATFDYASPEQIEARPLDASSDIYSLACVLYKLLTGSVPFPGETMLAPAAGHLSLPPPRPTALVPWLAPGLDDVIARGMAKNPADRYPTCRALAAAAAKAMDDFPNAPAPPYRVFMSRSGDGTGSGAHVGPVRTDVLGVQDTERLVGLVRRTRFFELPERVGELGLSAPPRKTLTVEIGCPGRAHRVIADLDSARRPPEFEELAATVEQLAATPTPAQGAAAAPPTQRPTPPSPVEQARADTPVAPVSRILQPPPPPPANQQRVTEVRPTRPPGAPVATVGPPSGPQQAVHGGYVPQDVGPGGPQQGGPPPFFPPPWQQGGAEPYRGPEPTPRRRRGVAVLVALLTAVVVAGGVTAWLVLGGGDTGGGGDNGGDASSQTTVTTTPAPTTPATPAAQTAFEALPRSAPLSDDVLIGPREVGDDDEDLFKVNAATNQSERLTGGPERDVSPILSPDRDTVIYLRRYPGGDPPDEYRAVAVDGSGDRALFDQPLSDCEQPLQPAWNPIQPSQIAVACQNGSGTTLRIISLDGATVQELDTGVPVLEDIAFSPDGGRIVYWGSPRDGARAGNLYTVTTDGTNERRQLTRTGVDNDPVWAPDGTTIAFSRGIAGLRQIFLLTLDDLTTTPLTEAEATDLEPAFSPDGTRLVFTSDRPGDAPGTQLWVVPVDGGDPTQLSAPEGEAFSTQAWGPR
jgi:hypothetical protein